MAVEVPAVDRDRAGLSLGTGGEELLEGLAQGGHGARLRALCGGVLAGGDAHEHLLGHTPGPVGAGPFAAAEDDAPVGGLAPAAGAVVEDEGLGSRRQDADAEADEPVVPCDVGLFGGLEGVDGLPGGDRPLDARGVLSGLC